MATVYEETSRWPLEPGSGRGRSHGTSSRESFDRWFRYPAGFASDYVSMLLDRLDITHGLVIDCFAGSGVTGTAARSRSLDFVGIEAHPLVAELARLKLSPAASGQQVRQLAATLKEALRVDGVKTQADAEAETDLIRRSFPADTLQTLINLRELIKKQSGDPAALYLKWALLATLRDVAAVKVGWPYQRPGQVRRPRHTDVISRFETRARLMADDLEGVEGSTSTGQVLVGDSRDSEVWARIEGRGAACVASPPYLNNFDYADATRLELYFWGEVTSWAGLRREVRADMLTATTQQATVGQKAGAVAVLEGSAAPVTREILALTEEIAQVQRDRGRRSKEYDRVVPSYFVAMSRILSNLHDALSPGATALWLVGDSAPYGVYVDTPRLIGELALAAGLEHCDDVRLRVRGERWSSNAERHKVPLAERLLVMRKAE